MSITNVIQNRAQSDKYKSEIHDLIPGGAHTYSKGDDQFPAIAPAAIAKGLGAWVWDVDGNKFLDCSMGLTSVSLGHAYEPVLEAVRKELLNGVNFQRPSYLEREMAKEFLSLVPCHQMIKFAKNGSAVTTAAVKIARAFTGRKIVAFPGDHPFYSFDDWFIGKTQCSRGVPEEFAALSKTYNSLDLSSLEKLFLEFPNQIACVISEPEKTHHQPDNYLKDLIDICHKHGALFIQDEMVTGFKTGFPGSITKYNVEPDLATWGKGIANGFSFCALTGKKEVMSIGGINKIGEEKVFLISSTHGGETHSMAAAIQTIKEFKNRNVLSHNHEVGRTLREKCLKLISDNKMSDYIDISNTDWMIVFSFKNKNLQVDNGFRTLFLQEMIVRGVLFQGVFVPCFSHNEAEINYFVNAFQESLGVYIKALEVGYEKYLHGQPTKPVFRKIN